MGHVTILGAGLVGSAMARMTGFTATVVARLLLDGSFRRSGISPPEFLGQTEGFFEKLRAGLDARNVRLTERISITVARRTVPCTTEVFSVTSH